MTTGVLALAFKVSRVRFWLYLGGTYAVGYIAGLAHTGTYTGVDGLLQALSAPLFLLHLLFFMFPANVFLYGVNDISDKDTDVFNPKKDDKEYRATIGDATKLYGIVVLSFIYGLTLMLLQFNDLTAVLLILSWMTLSVLYSAKPFRLKAVPVLDFVSNFLYVVPAILAFYQVTATVPPLVPLSAAFFWTSAMQVFSAIPDIDADRKANVRTTAVAIGRTASLLLCLVFWALFAAVLTIVTPWNYPVNLLTLVYPAIPLYLLLRPSTDITKTYWYFPYYTGVFGMTITLSLLLQIAAM
ncbi:MAG: prenyltransferase [Candidatus Thorarchaeota archaeon]|nr:prenyltransferase [Candidatus Thorarchaeota archaeon]